MKWKDFKIFGVEKEVKDLVGIFYHQDYTNHVMAGYGPSLGALKICNANAPFSVSLSFTHQTQMVKYALTHISCSKPQTCLIVFLVRLLGILLHLLWDWQLH